jgi:hypothetical protein
MLLREIIAIFFLRILRSRKYTVDKMQKYWLLKQELHMFQLISKWLN